MFYRVLLIALVLCVDAGAMDHRAVLEARKQGLIAPFSSIMKAARAAAGDGMVMLDADTLGSGSDYRIKVYFREQRSGQLVVVTLDARTVAVLDIADPRRQPRPRTLADTDPPANSRPIAPPGLLGSPGGLPGTADAGKSGATGTSDGGGKDGGKGGDSGGKDGKSGGKDGDREGKSNGRDGGRSDNGGRSGGKDGGRGGSGK